VTDEPTAVRPLVRDLAAEDLPVVVRIDEQHTGERKPAWWERVFARFLSPRPGTTRIGLAAEADGEVVGYLFGEVRAFEFGSEECGWVFAVGVDPSALRRGVASSLLDEAHRRFRDAGVAKVRTMVRRNEVPVLSLFRAEGYVGGPFAQLERDLEREA
jgi:ribosomal protein S18 acetylase RimI-like enzyme